ncbi:histidine acid phosphatase [Niveomyces insectorum RCEF 264]|uniref:Histidine acid phosphatase n=1 Tax=Niveomyces insectorum RCEF 264 TaxID=1081102 RepID=A0A167RES5_9HYPO|nr:histidine acid phosphatase [Niveomyces insectorum RCEF 264]
MAPAAAPLAALATLTTVLLAVAPAPAAAAESVLGLYVFHRHGDRTSKSFPPTELTALGADQVFRSGAYYRSRYVAADAPGRIAALSPDVAQFPQLSITAPSDYVLQPSANVFAQGLYPPAGAAAQQTLGNGTVTEPPLGGYQAVPVNLVANSAAAGAADSESSEWLQGGSGCNNAVVSSNGYFASAEYRATLSSTAGFYEGLLPALNTTFTPAQASFKNAYTIYDYVHVSEIHNQTLLGADVLTPAALAQLQTRADQHEWGLAYNASEPVRAIAGAVLAAQVLQSLNSTVLAPPASPLAAHGAPRVSVQFGNYATFMSFFGLANLTAASPAFYGIVDYAASIAFELVTNATVSTTGPQQAQAPLDPSALGVRFLLSNGSAGLTGGLTAYPLFGQSELVLPWATFAAEMRKIAVGDTATWCQVCGNSTGVCDPASLGTGSSSANSNNNTGSKNNNGGGMSRPVAGVIGALVTLAVILGFEALVMLVAGLRVVKKNVAVAGKAASAAA